MRMVVTGGGTGGHVYPALEVARLAISEGHEVIYLGSTRGIERVACAEAGVDFIGFPSSPIPRLWTPAGVFAALRILRSAAGANRFLSQYRPEVVFSTGGYAASPILTAAKSLGIPIVLHEQNSIPGRTNRIMGGVAKRVCIVFEEAAEFFPGKAIVTGMPVRKMLVEAASESRENDTFLTLCYGGSQGSASINEAVLTIATRVSGKDSEWLQIAGPKLFEAAAKTLERVCKPPGFTLKAFLKADELAKVYKRASLAIVRAGSGTITELALFGIPAIYIPLPHSHANHQMRNATAIEKIGGGSVIPQSELTPQRLESEWRSWRETPDRCARAREVLGRWFVPDAAARVLSVVKEVVSETAKRS